MRNVRLILIVVLVLAVISCSKKESVLDSTIQKATDIRVAEVKLGEVKEVITLPGTVEAWDVVPVAIETAGPIKTILPKEGDYIKAGDIILTLNSDALRANLESSRVQREARRTDFARTTKLYEQQAVSQKTFDDARDAMAVAESAYRVAREQQSKSVLRSPVSGVIDVINPKDGEYINAGYVVAKVVNMEKLKVYIEVPERDIQFINLRDVVNVYVADIAEVKDVVKGTVNYKSVTADPRSLTYKARVDLVNTEVIKPGRIVRVEIVKRDMKDTIAVPMYSVMDEDGSKYVYVEENKIAVRKNVALGPMVGDQVVILSGIVTGDKLVVSGQQFLLDNATVRVVE